jgi:hypothetical protein
MPITANIRRRVNSSNADRAVVLVGVDQRLMQAGIIFQHPATNSSSAPYCGTSCFC